MLQFNAGAYKECHLSVSHDPWLVCLPNNCVHLHSTLLAKQTPCPHVPVKRMAYFISMVWTISCPDRDHYHWFPVLVCNLPHVLLLQKGGALTPGERALTASVPPRSMPPCQNKPLPHLMPSTTLCRQRHFHALINL